MPDSIRTFSFDFDDYGLVWNFETASGRKESIRFMTNGTRFTNLLGTKDDLTQLYLGDAHFEGDDTLVLVGRWVETCITDTYTLVFDKDKVEVKTGNNSAFNFFKPDPILAERV